MRAPRRERERERGGPGGYGLPGGYGAGGGMGGGMGGGGAHAGAGPGDLEAIPPLVQAWLAGLNEATRLMLQGQLPEQRGLPQEADRELLQQISHHLGRPLSVPERKLMRELAREALASSRLVAANRRSAAEQSPASWGMGDRHGWGRSHSERSARRCCNWRPWLSVSTTRTAKVRAASPGVCSV